VLVLNRCACYPCQARAGAAGNRASLDTPIEHEEPGDIVVRDQYPDICSQPRYANLGTASYPSNFRDIAAGSGSCGPNQGYLTAAGWDFCTGLGSPLGKSGK
jgi:hypothetical protein